MRATRVLTAASLALGVVAPALVTSTAAPASAAGTRLDGTASSYFLSNDLNGSAEQSFGYGRPTDAAYVADTDGDGKDTLLIRRGNQYLVRDSLGSGAASSTFGYGRTTDVTLTGDWDGDGDDTLAVRRGGQYFFANSLRGGTADFVLSYGRATDTVLVGDWDGDGDDTLAVRRGNQYYISNDLRARTASQVIGFGRATDQVVVGAWGGGASSLGVRRGSVYYLNSTLRSGSADITFTFGRPTDHPVVGDWNGDGRTTVGVRRAAVAAPTYAQQLVTEVNAQRTRAGLRPLTASTCASGAASTWAKHLAATGQFYHQDLHPVLRTCNARTVAENLARTSGTPQQMVTMWMESPGHRVNILNPKLTSVGSAAVKDSAGRWVGAHVFVG